MTHSKKEYFLSKISTFKDWREGKNRLSMQKYKLIRMAKFLKIETENLFLSISKGCTSQNLHQEIHTKYQEHFHILCC